MSKNCEGSEDLDSMETLQQTGLQLLEEDGFVNPVDNPEEKSKLPSIMMGLKTDAQLEFNNQKLESQVNIDGKLKLPLAMLWASLMRWFRSRFQSN